MAEVTFDVTSTTPQKRTYDDCIVFNTDFTRNPSLTEQQPGSRHGSPAPSTSSSLTELSNINDAPGSAIKSSASASGSAAPPSAKRRKLGFIEAQAEKAVKQREKEEKARNRAEEKAQKDEEKRRAAEEKENSKRAKELEKAEKQAKKETEEKEKEEKRKAKEAEKAEKEAEKQKKVTEKAQKEAQKEAEKLKRERSQMRLGAFFGKPKPEATPPSTPDNVSEGVSSRRSSIASIDMEKPVFEPPPNKVINPEYERWILPFFVPEHTELAPYNRFKLSRQPDFEVTPDSARSVGGVRERFSRPRKRMKRTIPVKTIMSNIQASGIDVVDLASTAFDALGGAKYKCLQFREDIRPPYHGTYTAPVSPRTAKRICRNPFTRGLPDKNYDYDSEAEWEPPGDDDEDLNDEEEMSDDENDDELVDFLDDADDIARKRGPVADMEPISSGLCWAGEQSSGNSLNLEQYRMDFLHDATTFPIDPFSTKHWVDDTKSRPVVKQEANSSSMQPPRQPLSSLSPNATPFLKQEVGIDGKPIPMLTRKTSSMNNGRPTKMIEPEYMADFKEAVDGSDLTKAGLIEILKKQFPKCSKDAIKDTLGVVAVRVGKKEAEKKWQLV